MKKIQYKGLLAALGCAFGCLLFTAVPVQATETPYGVWILEDVSFTDDEDAPTPDFQAESGTKYTYSEGSYTRTDTNPHYATVQDAQANKPSSVDINIYSCEYEALPERIVVGQEHLLSWDVTYSIDQYEFQATMSDEISFTFEAERGGDCRSRGRGTVFSDDLQRGVGQP